MSKKTNSEKLQFPMRFDSVKDRELFTLLSATDNKSDLIKDALFYFMTMVESGKMASRHYPYNKLNIKMDINIDKYEVGETECIKDDVNEDIEIETEIDYFDEDDNMDDLDI